MLAVCTYSRFPCFLLVGRLWDISSGIGPCFPLAGVLWKFYANAGEKWTIQRQPLGENKYQEMFYVYPQKILVKKINESRKNMTVKSVL